MDCSISAISGGRVRTEERSTISRMSMLISYLTLIMVVQSLLLSWVTSLWDSSGVFPLLIS